MGHYLLLHWQWDKGSEFHNHLMSLAFMHAQCYTHIQSTVLIRNREKPNTSQFQELPVCDYRAQQGNYIINMLPSLPSYSKTIIVCSPVCLGAVGFTPCISLVSGPDCFFPVFLFPHPKHRKKRSGHETSISLLRCLKITEIIPAQCQLPKWECFLQQTFPYQTQFHCIKKEHRN